MVISAQWLDREAACVYLSITRNAFNRAVRSGRLPEPSKALGERSDRWTVKSLDNVMAGGNPKANDTHEAFNAYAEKIRAEYAEKVKAGKGRKAHAGRRNR